MNQQQDATPLRSHILIYEAPVPGGRTAVPVRISQEWTVVTGFASAHAVWRLFAAAARWTNHIRQQGNKEPQTSQELKDALIQAVTAWFESARHENPEAHYKPPANVANRAPVPQRLITLNSYTVELTARASNLAWTLHLGENPTQSLQDLLDTAESFRKPQDIPQPTKVPKTQKAKEPPPDARVDAVKSELIIICRPLGTHILKTLQTNGAHNLQEETTKELVRTTLRQVRGWYDHYVETAHAITDPAALQKELQILTNDLTDNIKRPRARLRTAACNLEQRRRNQKEGPPQEMLRALLDAAADLAEEQETQAAKPAPSKES